MSLADALTAFSARAAVLPKSRGTRYENPIRRPLCIRPFFGDGWTGATAPERPPLGESGGSAVVSRRPLFVTRDSCSVTSIYLA